jgi:hypothetical protein
VMQPGLPAFGYTAFLPLQTPIQHMIYTLNTNPDGTPALDAHGIQQGSYGAPIPRMIVCWWPLERRTWEVDPIDPDVVARYESDIHLLVPDPTVYNKPDRVIVNNLLYQVEGLATDWKSALPFKTASYGMLIGGEVHVRRVSSTGVIGGM